MNEIPNKKQMYPKTKAITLLIVLLLIGLSIGVVISKVSFDYLQGKKVKTVDGLILSFIQTLYTLGTTIIVMNITLLVGLLWVYADTFRKTKSSFLFGLLLFIGVLLAQSILALPILQATVFENLTIVGILPNMFETIALIILFYLSME